MIVFILKAKLRERKETENFPRGQRRHFVHHFQIADDQCPLR